MTQWTVSLLVALILAVAGAIPQVQAQSAVCPGATANLSAIAFETITVSTTAIGFTAATMTAAAVMAIATVETNTVRYRADGTAPTASVGHSAVAGSIITVCGPALSRFKMIRASADAPVQVTYYAR